MVDRPGMVWAWRRAAWWGRVLGVMAIVTPSMACSKSAPRFATPTSAQEAGSVQASTGLGPTQPPRGGAPGDCPSSGAGFVDIQGAGYRKVSYRPAKASAASCPSGLSGCVPMSVVDAPCPRTKEAWVWTGRRIVVYGGHAVDGTVLNSGASFDPVANRWESIATAGAPPPQLDAIVLGLPDGLVVWGAQGGGIYDFTQARWTEMPTEGAPPKGRFAAVIGGRLLVFVGKNSIEIDDAGWLYDPQARRWSRQAAFPLSPRALFGTAISREAILVWGGADERNWDRVFRDGAIYDPLTNRWRMLPQGGAPSGRYAPKIKAVPGGMFIVSAGKANRKDDASGERAFDGKRWTTVPASMPDLEFPDGRRFTHGGPDHVLGPAYGSIFANTEYDDPSGTSIPEKHQLDARRSDRQMLGWIGDELLIGDPSFDELYRVTLGGWEPLPLVGIERGRTYRVAWIGDRLVAWGGFRVLDQRDGAYSTGGDAVFPESIEVHGLYTDGFVWAPQG